MAAMPRQFLDADDPTVAISFKLPAKLAARARQRAKQQRRPLAAVLRELLRDWLEEPSRSRFKRKLT